MEKYIIITLEEARKYYQESSDISFKAMLETNFGKEKLLKKELPKTLGDLEIVEGFYIFSDSSILHYFCLNDDDNSRQNSFLYCKNVFKTEKQALSSLAMSELSQYMSVYNDGWIPDWNDGTYKYCIINYGKIFHIESYHEKRDFLAFKSREIAGIFLKNFESLIKQYFDGF